MDKIHAADILGYEADSWEQGYRAVAGVDEAGRGPLAGPVVAAAVILPRAPGRLAALDGLRDSKRLTPLRRQHFFPLICELAESYGLGIASVGVIDCINVHQATCLAMRRALACLPEPDMVLVDGPWAIPGLAVPQRPIVGGDDLSLSIAAASVLAKVFRDHLMTALAEHYPVYAFQNNKGYATAAHRSVLRSAGLSPLHRRSFCRRLLAEGGAPE